MERILLVRNAQQLMDRKTLTRMLIWADGTSIEETIARLLSGSDNVELHLTSLMPMAQLGSKTVHGFGGGSSPTTQP